MQCSATFIDKDGAFDYTVYMKPSIKRDLIKIITSAPVDRKTWLEANTQHSNIHRQAFWEIKDHLDKFRRKEIASQWFILPGLRGVGKTTILTQLYLDLPSNTPHKFFLSLERIHLLNAKIKDVLAVIEELVVEQLEALEQPVYLFIDEVQYLDKWALGLKIAFDRMPRVFIVCTGSSAIKLQSNPDVARRSLTIPVYPLDFTEYIAFKHHYKSLPAPSKSNDLQEKLRQALLESRNYQGVFAQLQKLRGDVSLYWKNLNAQACIKDYMRFGSLPFTLKIEGNSSKWRTVDALLEESLAKDVSHLARTQSSVSMLFPGLLRLLAELDTISLHRLSKIIGLNKRTLINMLSSLCSAEILNPIRPSGSAYRQVNRPNKYLFTTPAMRLTLAMKAGLTDDSRSGIEGRLMEDVVGLYLKRIVPGGLVHYDSKPGGADFILFNFGSADTAIPIEVGLKKRRADQAWQTLQRTKGKYGLVVTNTGLDIEPEMATVFVPLEYFLLI